MPAQVRPTRHRTRQPVTLYRQADIRLASARTNTRGEESVECAATIFGHFFGERGQIDSRHPEEFAAGDTDATDGGRNFALSGSIGGGQTQAGSRDGPYRSGRSADCVKVRNPNAQAVRRRYG